MRTFSLYRSISLSIHGLPFKRNGQLELVWIGKTKVRHLFELWPLLRSKLSKAMWKKNRILIDLSIQTCKHTKNAEYRKRWKIKIHRSAQKPTHFLLICFYRINSTSVSPLNSHFSVDRRKNKTKKTKNENTEKPSKNRYFIRVWEAKFKLNFRFSLQAESNNGLGARIYFMAAAAAAATLCGVISSF